MTQGVFTLKRFLLGSFLLRSLVVALLATIYSPSTMGQESSARGKTADAGSAIIVADQNNDGVREEIEPGVFLYGVAHRFAGIGVAKSFDCSPDGKTVVFAAGKIRFFDTETNQATDIVGVGDEVYETADYSADGRFVFSQTSNDGADFVRVFDAIDKSSVGTIQASVDDATRIKHNEQPDFLFRIQRLCVSSDAKLFALTDFNRVQVRDVESGKLEFYHGGFGHIREIAFSPDGSELFVLEGDSLRVIDLSSGTVKAKEETEFADKRIQLFTTDASKNLLAWVNYTEFAIYDLAKSQEVCTIKIPKDAFVRSIAFSDDGTKLVAGFYLRSNGGAKSSVVVVDVKKRRIIEEYIVNTNDCQRVRFSPDGKSILVAGRGIAGATEFFFNKDYTGEAEKFPIGPSDEIVMHPQGESFLTRTSGGQLTWFEQSSGTVKRTVQKPGYQIVEFNDVGTELLIDSLNNPKSLLRMDYASGKTKKAFSAKRVSKSGGVLNQLGSLMRTGGPDFLSMHGMANPMATRWSVDGSAFHALIGAMDFTKYPDSPNDYENESSFRYVKMDAETGKWLGSKKLEFDEFNFEDDQRYYAAIRQDGSRIAVGQGGRIFIVDTQTGEPVADFSMASAKRLRKIEFSPDQNLLAASSAEGIWVWDLQTGNELKHFELEAPNHFAFSKDGLRMAVCQGAKSSPVQVFETDSWKTVLSRNRTEHDRSSLALSDDGKKLLIGLADCRIEMWDLDRVSK